MSPWTAEMLNGAASGISNMVTGNVLEGLGGIVNNACLTNDDLKGCYEKLQEEKGRLLAMEDDKMTEASRHKEKDVSKTYRNWSLRVKKIEIEVRKIEKWYAKIIEETNWDLISRPGLFKIMGQKCEELEKLCLQGQFPMGILVEKPPDPVIIMPAPEIGDKGSLDRAFRKTVDHLKDKDIKRVGLWGMPGIGKTTIMKNLNNNKNIADVFNIIIFVKMPEDGSIKKLQGTIAQRLKLNVEDISDVNIASRISEELKDKKYLLLLDEVWKTIDLSEIGFFGDEKESKVVLATRSRHICYYMKADVCIRLKRLSQYDAYTMFKQIAGNYARDPVIEPIAELVAKECACLPLLLEKVAEAFSPKHKLELWKDGLRTLRESRMKVMNELIESLKFCYEELDCDADRSCFLYCALYPEEFDICINYLLECWMVEGFVEGANQYMIAREKGHTILDKLINASLLECDEKGNYVKMNKVLRKMALAISSESSNFKVLVKTPKEQQEPLSDVEWQQVSRISLIDNKLCALPEMPNCENLSSLLLQKNKDLKSIPGSFFRHMEKLKVLDLQGTGITSLPSSVSFLMDLKALYLSSCVHFVKLSINKNELPFLEILDIRHTKINHMPIEIGHLTHLRSLRISLNFDLRQSSKMESFKDILFPLSLLEEIRMDIVSDNPGWEEFVLAIIKEVDNLKHSVLLLICFPTTAWLEYSIPKNLLWEESYFTSQPSTSHYVDNRIKSLKFVNGCSADLAISKILEDIEAFELIGHKGALKLLDFNVSYLQVCLINSCSEIQTIVDGGKIGRKELACLQKMYINNVPKLASIWEGVVGVGSLAQLKTLSLHKCLSLKKIFSSGMIAQLSKLQSLKVDECSAIEEIIMASENQGLERNALPSLKEIILLDLPKLKSIWIDDSINWPSLTRVKIHMCPVLRRLPFNNNNNAINLKCIEVQQSWWNALEWEKDADKEKRQSFCTFN